MNLIGVKNEFDRECVTFYDANYDIVESPDFDKRTRLLKAEHGLHYLGNASNKVCRFCEKTEQEVSFSKIAHVFPESIGNKALASNYECNNCNQYFGSSIENDYCNFFQIYHNLMRSKNQKYKCKVPCNLRTNKCMEYCIQIEWIDGRYQLSQCSEVGEYYTMMGKTESIIKLPIPKCNPIAVFKTLVKMAITVLPFTELDPFKNTISWLLETDHKNIYPSDKKLIIRYQMIPGFNVTKYPHFVVYRRKTTVFNLPYMLFNLTYGCFSLLIEVPRDNYYTTKTINEIPFPPIPFHISSCGYWDMSSNKLQPNQVHEISLNHKPPIPMDITSAQKYRK